MYFESTPADFTPVRDGLLFDFCCEDQSDVEAVIIDDSTNAEVERLQIKNVEYGTIDIAPYIAKPTSFRPIVFGESRLQPLDTRSYHVDLYHLGDTVLQCSSASVRVSSNGYFSDELPFLTTTMGVHRVISAGEFDNIGIYSSPATRIAVKITSDVGDEIFLESNSTTGAFQLVFAANDLSANATAAKLEIFYNDEEYLAEFDYIIQPRCTTGMRLAWRTVEGNIEQYTFPVIAQGSALATRNDTSTKDGTTQVLQSLLVKQLHLISDFEPRSTLDALAEIVAASEVWVVYPNSYRTSIVDVALQYDITNTIGRIEIDIVSERKEGCV